MLKILPGKSIITEVAIELGVETAFVEKDWYSVQVIGMIADLEHPEITPVFSGGTSLSKGHKLIKRFSEDIDFRVQVSSDIFNKNKRSHFKKHLIDLFNSVDGIKVDQEKLFAADGNKFFRLPLVYEPHFEIPYYIRNELKVEFSFLPPIEKPTTEQISSLIGELANENENISIVCTSPVEIAGDKLSALIWRVLKRDRNKPEDDPTFIRHLHDLSALSQSIHSDIEKFCLLFDSAFTADQMSSKRNTELSKGESIDKVLEILKGDELYRHEYSSFVDNMSYESSEEQISFDQAVDSLVELSKRFIS